jgi:hypothetical protein
MPFQAFLQHLLERRVFPVLLEHSRSARGPVQDVEDITACRSPWSSWHMTIRSDLSAIVKRLPTPFQGKFRRQTLSHPEMAPDSRLIRESS